MAFKIQRKGFEMSRRKLLLGSTAVALFAAGIGLFACRPFFCSHAATDNETQIASDEKTEPLELSFEGPFSPRQKLLVEQKENPFVVVKWVSFSNDFWNSLNVDWGFSGEPDYYRRVRLTVTINTADGKSRILEDSERYDIRLTSSRRVGSSMASAGATYRDAIDLPQKPSEITKVTMRLTPMILARP